MVASHSRNSRKSRAPATGPTLQAARGSKLRIASLFATAVVCAAPAHAQNFYEGKTVTILVGSDVGGGFDAFARLLSRHLGRALPGAPTFVVENMPGAGSAIAAGHLYARAPKDGTYIGAFVPSGLLMPLFEGRAANYDTTKFQFLGSANASARLCVSYKGAKVASWADAMKQRVIVGAGAVASASYDYAWLHKNLHQGLFDVVAGYKGTAEILLAMERGEVEATCGLDRSSLRAQRPDVMRNNGFNYLLRMAVKPEPELDALGVPEASSFARNERDRAVSDLIAAQQVFGRPYLVAPGVPVERVGLLRAAFEATMRDPRLASEAAALGLDIDSANGARVTEAINNIYAAPAAVIDGARAAIRP